MTKKLMNDDLARSGLTSQDAKNLKIEYLNKDVTYKLSNHKCESYKIPYLDIDGNDTGFYRLRLLNPVKGFTKPRRYHQPPDTLPKAYFPVHPKWKEVIENSDIPIFITEGEKKAAKATKEGFFTIGLGGVWSWMSKKKKLDLIPDLKQINWKGRDVITVFDSDIVEKEGVALALDKLNTKLTELGANPYSKTLPNEEDGKNGLDDYLVKYGTEEFEALPEEEFQYAIEMQKLNSELAVIHKISGVWYFRSNIPVKPQALTDTLMTNRLVWKGEGENRKQVSAVKEWLKWSQRREHEDVTYAPGKPHITDNCLNLWRGMPYEPKKGSVRLWNELLDYIFDPGTLERKWFEQWAAYPLQNLGAKMNTYVLVWGLEQGTGKSLIGYTLGRLYGNDNFQEINQEELADKYNDWAEHKQFVMIEEMSGTDSNERRHLSNKIRHMITRQRVYVDVKYQPKYSTPDCINYYASANNPNASHIENEDRRAFIHELTKKPLPRSFYQEYDAWYKSDDVAALYHHLMQIDLADFDPLGAAPVTSAKLDMQRASMSELEAWCHDLASDPDSILQIDGSIIACDLWELNQLRAIYDPDNRKRTSVPALSHAMTRAGFKALPMQVRVNNKLRRFWPIRNKEKWQKADYDKVKNYYESWAGTSSEAQGREAKRNNVVPLKKKTSKRRGKQS